MRTRKLGKWGLALAALAGVCLLASQPALACATCYTSSLGPKGLQAIKSGILILLLPTAAIFGALILLTFWYRNSCPAWRRVVPEQVPPQPSQLDLLALNSYETDSAASRPHNTSILPAQ